MPNLQLCPDQVQVMLADGIDDASCVSINHKYRLIAFGRKNSHVSVFTIDEETGGLELLYTNVLSSKDFPGNPGQVNHIKWTPDGSVVIISWQKIGSFSLWSCFGSLLFCTLAWDYGFASSKSFCIKSMDWSCEGYHLHLVVKDDSSSETKLLQLDFIKSALTGNPCVYLNPYLLLQGDDKILVNNSDTLDTLYESIQSKEFITDESYPNEYEIKAIQSSKFLSASKLWNTILVPTAYMNANWPIRFSALDQTGHHLAVAGKAGIALYFVIQKKWKLFGNELQEKDFVVTGGILWWHHHVIICNYNLSEQKDEIRVYSRDQKLDNKFAYIYDVSAPIMLSNVYENQFIVFTADSRIMIFQLAKSINNEFKQINLLYIYDVKNICLHPAFVISLSLTNFKNDTTIKAFIETESLETIFMNVAGRVLMIQREKTSTACQFSTTCLASCVECIWFFIHLPEFSKNAHLQESLWFYCGGQGMRVWLPVFPRYDQDRCSHKHSYMAKRIMLSFNLRIYPLAISFEDAIIFGVENDTTLFLTDQKSHFSLPFSQLKRTSQLYLHHILKQLIKRNLGYNAWEIARDCSTLPYFPHSLELLLHEVLEQEATCKDPIPDALLPSVIEFIKEFPCYLQTIVQCARKTEIALWPYLFNEAGKPKDLFQQCMDKNQLYAATNYLIILQNFESSSISKQCALVLLDAALKQKNWNLSHDLVRFQLIIDSNEMDSPKTLLSVCNNANKTQLLHQLTDVVEFNLALSHLASRASSNTYTLDSEKKQVQQVQQVFTYEEIQRSKKNTSEYDLSLAKQRTHTEMIDTIVCNYLKMYWRNFEVLSLGYISAALDFELVNWMSKEKKKEKNPTIVNFVDALNVMHQHLELPKPFPIVKTFQNNELKYNRDLLTKDKNDSIDSGFGSNFSQYNHQSETSCLSSYVNNKNFAVDMSVSKSELEELFPSKLCNSKSTKNIRTQLRYLLQIFFEADCLDFALLISIILLDNTSVTRICNTAARSPLPLKLIRQLKTGLEDLTKWSMNECYGYRFFMLNCSNDIKILQNILAIQTTVSAPEYVLQSKQNFKDESDYLRDRKLQSQTIRHDKLPSSYVSKNTTSRNDNISQAFNQNIISINKLEGTNGSSSCSVM